MVDIEYMVSKSGTEGEAFDLRPLARPPMCGAGRSHGPHTGVIIGNLVVVNLERSVELHHVGVLAGVPVGGVRIGAAEVIARTIATKDNLLFRRLVGRREERCCSHCLLAPQRGWSMKFGLSRHLSKRAAPVKQNLRVID